ncbi:hypothetical protein HDV00_012778 [Rhizophlyctis rosea]|nr:hypothetical protein HDV00_012778 [Rhizophlyctis rosea]
MSRRDQPIIRYLDLMRWIHHVESVPSETPPPNPRLDESSTRIKNILFVSHYILTRCFSPQKKAGYEGCTLNDIHSYVPWMEEQMVISAVQTLKRANILTIEMHNPVISPLNALPKPKTPKTLICPRADAKLLYYKRLQPDPIDQSLNTALEHLFEKYDGCPQTARQMLREFDEKLRNVRLTYYKSTFHQITPEEDDKMLSDMEGMQDLIFERRDPSRRDQQGGFIRSSCRCPVCLSAIREAACIAPCGHSQESSPLLDL